ncbi:MAG: hypothetical protein JKY56_14300 [Kofleriaceae bacterium]|nr:hypothetical protein [Kofleriaceae bacterium]
MNITNIGKWGITGLTDGGSWDGPFRISDFASNILIETHVDDVGRYGEIQIWGFSNLENGTTALEAAWKSPVMDFSTLEKSGGKLVKTLKPVARKSRVSVAKAAEQGYVHLFVVTSWDDKLNTGRGYLNEEHG